MIEDNPKLKALLACELDAWVENDPYLSPREKQEMCIRDRLIIAAVNTIISIDEKFKEKILNKEATRLGKICDHTVKLLFSAFAQTVKIKISFHNI